MKIEKARFHINFGPDTLFQRVTNKMRGERNLLLHANHFKKRKDERSIDAEVIEKIKNFNSNEWDLKTCEVRTDTGKFVNSTWENNINGKNIWITIGYKDAVVTIIEKKGKGEGNIIKEGDLYNYVYQENLKLLKEEQK